MAPDNFVTNLLLELRGKLPDQSSGNWYARVNDLVNWTTDQLRDTPNQDAVEFVLESLRSMRREETVFSHVLGSAASSVLRRKLAFTPEQVLEMINLSSLDKRAFPFKGILKAAESVPMTPEIADSLRRLRPCITEYLGGDMRELHARIDVLLNGPAPKTSLQVQGAWTQIVFEEIAGSPLKAIWERIFLHAAESKSSEPPKKWLAAAGKLADELGPDKFLECAVRWLSLGPSPKRPGVQVSAGESEYQKGFLWFLAARDDVRLPALIAAFAEAALKKIPMLGAVSQKVGNACVNVLAELPGLAPVSQLSALAQRIRYDTAQRLIEEALTRAAQKAGVSREQLEEMSISDYGLGPDGTLQKHFDDYLATVAIEETASVVIRWSDAQGKALKAAPATVKENHADEWKELQRTVKDMEKTLSAQRTRIETLLLTQRAIPIDTLNACYLRHPLMADMSRRLIWQFDSVLGIWHEGRVIDSAEREIDLSKVKEARLWHPITSDAQTIFHWRCWLEDHGVRQPFKQAHREVYLITGPERETRVYSNRFAAHILRQHQFAALCAERGWTFRLMGQWDSHNTPTLELPHFGLRVKYEVDFPSNENEVSGMNIYLLIRTGRLSFVDHANVAQPLDSIPPAVFSEVLRDVDLFTGVTSIGMDAAWGTREQAPFREYWNAFSFGELTEMAVNRKGILARLIPRLPIKDRCTLESRFLNVRGDRAEYRIHLGSGNVLMEPGSRYLCIIEGAATRSRPRDLALPFEGDRMLSVILSKAFLLADDRKITDESIRRQLAP